MRDLRAELAESLALKKLVLRAPLRQDNGISELPEELLHEGGRSDEVDGRKSLAEGDSETWGTKNMGRPED